MGSSYSTNPTNTGVPVATLRKSQNFSITSILRVFFVLKTPILQLKNVFTLASVDSFWQRLLHTYCARDF